MHSLQELVDVVSRNKVKSIRTLEPRRGEQPDMLHDFYERLCRQEFADDDAAAAHYGYPSARSRAYRKQRQKLKERLFRSLIFVEVNRKEFSPAQTAFYECQKKAIGYVRILFGRNFKNLGIELAKETLRTAEKFEFIHEAVELLRLIKSTIAIYDGDKRYYMALSKKTREFEKLRSLEDLASDYYEEIHVNFSNAFVLSEDTRVRAHAYIAELEKESNRIKTWRFHQMKFAIIYMVSLLENNFDEVIANGKRAISFFETKPNFSSHFMGSHYIHTGEGQLFSGRYQEGLDNVQKAMRLFESGSHQWYRLKELEFLLNTYSENYKQACIVLNDILGNASFRHQVTKRRQLWRLCQVYLHYLILMGKLQNCSLPSTPEVENIHREIPAFAADKRGYNIPVLIIQILILIQHRSYEEISIRLEAIQKYVSRYLKRNMNFRSNCFVKMLLQIPKHGFRRRPVIRATTRYHQRLLTEGIARNNPTLELEIIPYEHLWKYVLESLPD